jgi:hypothetical protein
LAQAAVFADAFFGPELQKTLRSPRELARSLESQSGKARDADGPLVVLLEHQCANRA